MKQLLPYQVFGAHWLAQPMVPGQRGKLLGDAPGLGKTLQAIRGADRIGARSILVVCPAIARPHWQREFLAEQQIQRSVVRVESGADLVQQADVMVVSWNLIAMATNHGKKLLASRRWDVVILDEAHAAKTPSAVRTRAVYGVRCGMEKCIGANAGAVWALTGTPIMSGPHEIWTHYRALFPIATKRVLSYAEWMLETCVTAQTVFGEKVMGVRPDRAVTLREKLSPFILRRRKSDVSIDLPSLSAHDIPLGINEVSRQIVGDAVKNLGVEDATIAAAVAEGVEVDGLNLASLSTLQRILGQAKVGAASALIEGDLTGGVEKAVVFAKHRDTVARLTHGLSGFHPVGVDGSTRPQDRQEAIDRFQSDPRCRVFVGQIDACSTAITLTAAADVYVVEASWVPAINGQAIQRCHRIGQTRPVTARFLYAEGTVDELVSKALARKAATLEALGLEDA